MRARPLKSFQRAVFNVDNPDISGLLRQQLTAPYCFGAFRRQFRDWQIRYSERGGVSNPTLSRDCPPLKAQQVSDSYLQWTSRGMRISLARPSLLTSFWPTQFNPVTAEAMLFVQVLDRIGSALIFPLTWVDPGETVPLAPLSIPSGHVYVAGDTQLIP
jgi:hypothetical protein